MVTHDSTEQTNDGAMKLLLLLLLEGLMLLDKGLLNVVRHNHPRTTPSSSNHSLSVSYCWLRWRLYWELLLFESIVWYVLELLVWATAVARRAIPYLEWDLSIWRFVSTTNLCRRSGLHLLLHMLVVGSYHCQWHVSLIFLTAIIKFWVTHFPQHTGSICLYRKNWIYWCYCLLRLRLSVIQGNLLQVFCINDLLHLLQLLKRDSRQRYCILKLIDADSRGIVGTFPRIFPLRMTPRLLTFPWKMILTLFQNTIVNVWHLLQYDIFLFLHIGHRLHVLYVSTSIFCIYVCELFLWDACNVLLRWHPVIVNILI